MKGMMISSKILAALSLCGVLFAGVAARANIEALYNKVFIGGTHSAAFGMLGFIIIIPACVFLIRILMVPLDTTLTSVLRVARILRICAALQVIADVVPYIFLEVFEGAGHTIVVLPIFIVTIFTVVLFLIAHYCVIVLERSV